MSHPRARLDVEALLQEADWVRGLVARLLGDPHAVEDVVQETWVAALASGDEVARRRGPAGLRAWLAAVARNLALGRGRSDGRRRWHEARAAAPECGGSGEASAADEEARLRAHQRLAEALLALEEPYRRAVVLRHLDGLPYRAVGERLGIGEAAARQRVHRGLAMLRARLERSLGGEGAGWARALAAVLPGGKRALARSGWHAGGTAAKALASGGAVMGSKAIVAGLAAGAVLLVGWGLQRGGSNAERAPSAGRERTALAALPAREFDGSVVPDPVASPPSSLAPATSVGGAREPVASQSAAPRAEPASHVLLAVRDAAGAPLPGARALEAASLRVLGTSDAAGRLALELPAELAARLADPEGLALVVGREGYVDRPLVLRSPEPESPEPEPVVLLALPELVGRALDPEGLPLEGRGRVRVDVLRAGDSRSAASGPWQGETMLEPDGSFRLAGLPLGELRRVSVDAERFPETELLLERRLEPGASERVELVLERGATVEGVVLDENDRPVPGAFVWAEDYFWDESDLVPSTHADDRGRFRLEGVDVEGSIVKDGMELSVLPLFARHGAAISSSGPTACLRRDDAIYEVELHLLEAPCVLSGTVLREDGSAAAELQLLGIDAEGRLHHVQTDEHGNFRFELVPGSFELSSLWFTLDVIQLSVEYRTVLKPGEQRAVELCQRALSPSSLEGRLIGSDASSLGLRVEGMLRREGLTVAPLGQRRLACAEDGSFATQDLPPGRYRLVPVVPPGLAALPAVQEIELAPDTVSQGWTFLVRPAVAFAGRVLSDAHPLSALRLELVFDERTTGLAPEPLSTTPDAQGRFAFEPVPTGRYRLRVRAGHEVVEELALGPQGAAELDLYVP